LSPSSTIYRLPEEEILHELAFCNSPLCFSNAFQNPRLSIVIAIRTHSGVDFVWTLIGEESFGESEDRILGSRLCIDSDCSVNGVATEKLSIELVANRHDSVVIVDVAISVAVEKSTRLMLTPYSNSNI